MDIEYVFGESKMNKKLCIILGLVLIFFLTALGYAEEYEFLRTWQPNNSPRGLAVDKDGNLYAAGDQMILKYSPSGALLLEIKNLPNQEAYFVNAWEMWVAVDDSGNIYASCMYGHRVIKFDSSGNYVWHIGGTQGSGDTQFNEPMGLDVDSSGNVYVCDRQNRRILKFDSSGTFQTKWGTPGSGDGQFEGPRDIAVDRKNNEIYVIDEWRWPRRVQVFNLTGTLQRQWETSSGDSQINNPYGIAVDSDSSVYVCDTNWDNTNKVDKFSSTGTYITKIGGFYGYDNYHFNGLHDVAVDYSGKLYLVDHQWNNYGGVGRRIMKYRLKGSPTVSFTNPANNSFVTGTVEIQASVDIASGYTVNTVEVYINDTKLGDATTSGLVQTTGFKTTAATTYKINWNTTTYTNGPYTLWIIATNNEGTKTKEKITSTVVNGDSAPTVSITNPSANETVRGTVNFQVSATDDNAVTKVEFYVDEEKVGTDTSSPYEYSWDTMTKTDDIYPIKAIAYDTLGQHSEHGFMSLSTTRKSTLMLISGVMTEIRRALPLLMTEISSSWAATRLLNTLRREPKSSESTISTAIYPGKCA